MSKRPQGNTVAESVEAFISPSASAPRASSTAKRRGRPKKANSVSKGVSVYFTPEEKAALEAEAEKMGLSVASFVRVQIKKDLGI